MTANNDAKSPSYDANHPLHKLFAGLVEQVFFSELGIADPSVTEYVTRILVDFVHVDSIYRLHSVDGATIREVSRMEAEAYLGPEIDATRRTLLVNRFIGDFTLFWAGVYPENLCRPRTASRLHEFLLQGKRSYGIAGELSGPTSHPPGALLRHLSADFEYCVHGLQLVRRGWEHMGRTIKPN